MSAIAQNLANHLRAHRCYSHPVFQDWARVNTAPDVIGALFHQIQCFCSATRPDWNLPEGLAAIGMPKENHLIQEIIDSEDNHGLELAVMAGYILNRAAGWAVCPDLDDQEAVEDTLKGYSDKILGTLPGYDPATGVTAVPIVHRHG